MAKNGVWNNLSISKKLYFVVGIMALLILIELLTLRFAMGNLSAVRAFVGGEGLWSKGQRQAVYQLQRYSITKNESDYQAFEEALTVPDGDHIARMEMSKKNPNFKIIALGFKQGRIHEDDIEPMVHLLTRFHNISYISEAVEAWTKGDLYISELREIGLRYKKLISTGNAREKELRALSDELKVLNDKLSIVTDKFSDVLGEGSRWLENLVFVILFSLVLTVESVGLTLTFFTSRAISGGLAELNRVAGKMGQGHFEERLEVKSGDEIGQLTYAVNSMGSLLEKSYSELKKSHQELEEKVLDRTARLEEIARENATLYEEAKTAVKMRDEFLSIASHELRTPITAINLHLQLMERLTRASEQTLDATKINELSLKAIEMSRRLGSLQEVLMDLTRIRLGKLELQKERHDIVALVHDCVGILSSDAAKARSQLSIDSTQPLWVNIDLTRMSQVVTNLVSNAIKYGQGSPIVVSTQLQNGQAVIEVKDLGPGIPAEKQAQIFERFERLQEDEKIMGLGLGLYITKQIVQAHGGSISVMSNTSEGTVFTVTLPLS